MRKLVKSVVPSALQQNKERWTDAWALKPHTRPRGKKALRESLFAETNGTCACCEGEVRSLAHDHVEHIFPKDRFPDLALEWTSLTIAYPRCNVNKGAIFDDNVMFINPYTDKIEEHLNFAGPLIVGLTIRGNHTVHELDLNEVARLEARIRAIKSLEQLCQSRDSAEDGWSRSHYGNLISELPELPELSELPELPELSELSELSEQAYSASLRAYLKARRSAHQTGQS